MTMIVNNAETINPVIAIAVCPIDRRDIDIKIANTTPESNVKAYNNTNIII